MLGYDTSLGKVQGALSALPEDARRHMLADITPKLVSLIVQASAAEAGGGHGWPARPEHPLQGRSLRDPFARPSAGDRREDEGGSDDGPHSMGAD